MAIRCRARQWGTTAVSRSLDAITASDYSDRRSHYAPSMTEAGGRTALSQPDGFADKVAFARIGSDAEPTVRTGSA